MRQDGAVGIRIYRLLYAGIWLVFLSLPVAYAFDPEVSPGARFLTLGATATFIAIYLAHFWRDPQTVESPAGVRRTVLIVIVLGLLAVAAIPGAGYTAISFAPFLTASLVFALPVRPGVLSGIAVWVLAALACLPFAVSLWPILGTGLGVLFIVLIRLADSMEHRQQAAEEELRRAAERDAIARDVHDVLGHSLTVLSIRAQLAARLIDRDPEQAREEVQRIDALARESLGQVRSTVSRLRTPRLEAELDSAREALAAAGITAEVTAEGQPDSAHAELFAWALREAVTNVVRHAEATRCRIRVQPQRLQVEDDGVGLPGDAEGTVAGQGQGLRGLKERATGAGADLQLRESGIRPDRPGTVVEVVLS
ncbi:sensor histidine kinase [Nesterenkonia sp. K-15-9-6]|uniref:sensor histidine kinase n=1 Tax=Nesterenkonia sp. K-15-9-6 TaxID=3093918 RepID=UPI004044419C